MIIIFKKIISAVITAATVFSCATFAPPQAFDSTQMSISASAASVSAPSLSKINIYSNKIELKVKNISSYSDNTKIVVMVGGRYVKTYTASTLKKSNVISVFHNGSTYLKPSTTYSISVRAAGNGVSGDTKISVKTDSKTYYNIPSSTQLYTLSNGKYTAKGKTTKLVVPKGTLYSSTGVAVAGKSKSKYDSDYVKIENGTYKGKFVKVVAGKIVRVTERTAKVRTVVDYAAGMNGGRYVWAGTGYAATDCSGLTMLSYAQVGKSISHSVYTQARMGKAVSMSNIQAGDLIICNNYGHVAMYIGNNQIVHAMSPYYGIKIQNVSAIKYCGSINTIRRIL